MTGDRPRRVVRLKDLRPAEPPLDAPPKRRARPRDAAKLDAIAALQEARLDAMPPTSWRDPATGRRVLRLPYYL